MVGIAAGSVHTAAVTAEGELYTFGGNSSGQLGLAEAGDCVYAPRLVDALSGRAVVMVACGDEHTVVLTRDGAVLSFGCNEYGQLGRETPLGLEEYDEDDEDIYALPDAVPGEVRHAALEGGEVVVEVAAGGHCTAVVTASGKTVTFGRADEGAVGVVTFGRADEGAVGVVWEVVE